MSHGRSTHRLQEDNNSAEDNHQDLSVDITFYRCVADMKPFILSLPDVHERQRTGLWIERLCGSNNLSDPLQRKNRCLYAQLLLHMLRGGEIEEPFTRNPPPGPLKLIPAYMAQTILDCTGLNSIREGQDGDTETKMATSVREKVLTSEQTKRIEAVSDISRTSHEDHRLLAVQHQHDKFVTEVLKQKNAELEEQRTVFNARLESADIVNAEMQEKLHILGRQLRQERTRHKHHINALASEMSSAHETEKQHLELKIQEMALQHEEVVADLQHKHIVAMEALSQETRQSAADTGTQYAERITTLEGRVHQLQMTCNKSEDQLRGMRSETELLQQIKKQLTSELDSLGKSDEQSKIA